MTTSAPAVSFQHAGHLTSFFVAPSTGDTAEEIITLRRPAACAAVQRPDAVVLLDCDFSDDCPATRCRHRRAPPFYRCRESDSLRVPCCPVVGVGRRPAPAYDRHGGEGRSSNRHAGFVKEKVAADVTSSRPPR